LISSSLEHSSSFTPQIQTGGGPPNPLLEARSEKSEPESDVFIRSKPGTEAESDTPVYEDPRKDLQQEAKKEIEKKELESIQKEVASLSARDREVRTHPQAHAAVGGHYAGAPTYQFKRGPDGVNYAVSGEVSISTSKESTPEATLKKAQVVRRAALAPAEPSPQDRRVAALATRMEMEARTEIMELQVQETQESKQTENSDSEEPDTSAAVSSSESSTSETSAQNKIPSIELPQLSSLFSNPESSPGMLFSEHA